MSHMSGTVAPIRRGENDGMEEERDGSKGLGLMTALRACARCAPRDYSEIHSYMRHFSFLQHENT